MFEIFQKVAVAVTTTILNLIQANFGIQNLGIVEVPAPEAVEETIVQETVPTATPASKLIVSPLPKNQPREKLRPTPSPATATPTPHPTLAPTPAITSENISISWKNVTNQGSYRVSETIPVEIEIHGPTISKVELTVGSDYSVCNMTQKPYSCPLELNKFFRGITGQQHFPIQVNAYQPDGTIHRSSVTVFVVPN